MFFYLKLSYFALKTKGFLGFQVKFQSRYFDGPSSFYCAHLLKQGFLSELKYNLLTSFQAILNVTLRSCLFRRHLTPCVQTTFWWRSNKCDDNIQLSITVTLLCATLYRVFQKLAVIHSKSVQFLFNIIDAKNTLHNNWNFRLSPRNLFRSTSSNRAEY